MRRVSNTLCSAFAGLALSFVAGGAAADVITYTISAGNAALSGFTGPYATATVNRTDATHATITFDSLTNGGYLYLMGGNDAVGVQVNAATWTVASITSSNSGTGFTPGPVTNVGASNVGTFGSFNQVISSFDGFTHANSQISFVLTNTGGTWASAGNVLTTNAEGLPVAAHIFACATPCNAVNGAAVTGYATVPIPAAAWLFGSGLVGLIAIARRRSRGTDQPVRS